MTATFTSVLAFQATVSERDIQTQHLLKLYETHGAMSDREASYRTGWAPAHVSARRNDLVKSGQVCEMGRKKDRDTGMLVKTWGTSDGSLGI